MELDKLQTRSLDAALAVREGTDSRTIEGVAIVTNQETRLFENKEYREIEVIDPACLNADFMAKQDIKLNMYHNREMTLARNNKGKGNLSLETREDGLHFAFDAPTYDLGERALQMVREGVINGCSFEFYPDKYTIEEREGKDGKTEYVVRHTQFRSLQAVTLALDPAYKQTSVNAREEYQKANEPKEEDEPKEEEEETDENKELEKKKADADRRRECYSYIPYMIF